MPCGKLHSTPKAALSRLRLLRIKGLKHGMLGGFHAWRISTKHIRLSYSANRSVTQLEQDTWASGALILDEVDKTTHQDQVSRIGDTQQQYEG